MRTVNNLTCFQKRKQIKADENVFFRILIRKKDSKTKTCWFMHYVFMLIINIPFAKHEGRELSDKHIFNSEGPLIYLRLYCIVNTGDVSFSFILWWVQCVSKNRISLCREKWLSLVDTMNSQSRPVFKLSCNIYRHY